MIPIVLSIAGTDPSGGAGAQADIKAISATGSYAASVITALVAQNTCGVSSIFEISSDFIRDQINVVFDDLSIAAVKIGMLHEQRIMELIQEALLKHQPPHIVLDPVMITTSGASLLKDTAIHFLKKELLPLANLITPNLFEAEQLLENQISSIAEMHTAAERLARIYKTNVLIKGGHLQAKKATDVLYLYDKKHSHCFETDYIHSKHTHGTGCTLSSAIASYLAQSFPLVEAIHNAKNYLSNAILAAQNYPIGHGAGPVDHFYYLKNRNNINNN